MFAVGYWLGATSLGAPSLCAPSPSTLCLRLDSYHSLLDGPLPPASLSPIPRPAVARLISPRPNAGLEFPALSPSAAQEQVVLHSHLGPAAPSRCHHWIDGRRTDATL